MGAMLALLSTSSVFMLLMSTTARPPCAAINKPPDAGKQSLLDDIANGVKAGAVDVALVRQHLRKRVCACWQY